MTRFLSKFPEQLQRLAIAILLLFGLLLVAKYLIIPRSFQDASAHRRMGVSDELNKPIQYAGLTRCAEHHQKQHKEKLAGYHTDLSCEICHGAGAAHAAAPKKNKLQRPKGRDFCPICHEYNMSKPTGFPQILTANHNPGEACTECHDAHDPEPPEVPEKCSACHGLIARTKAVSPHAKVECTTCHTVPDEHKTKPHLVRPTKPQSRDFCGKCHDKNKKSENDKAPKLNLGTHHLKYKCWQCHYPHLPEID